MPAHTNMCSSLYISFRETVIPYSCNKITHAKSSFWYSVGKHHFFSHYIYIFTWCVVKLIVMDVCLSWQSMELGYNWLVMTWLAHSMLNSHRAFDRLSLPSAPVTVTPCVFSFSSTFCRTLLSSVQLGVSRMNNVSTSFDESSHSINDFLITLPFTSSLITLQW